MTCASDWIGFNCGDMVREKEGRHIGRVEAVLWATKIKVRWEENGWTEQLSRRDLIVVEKARNCRLGVCRLGLC